MSARSRVGALHLVGIGDRNAHAVGLLVEETQPIAAVLQPLGNDMNDVLVALDAAMHHDEPRAHHHFAHPLQHLRPDHRIGDAGLVLDGHEHHACGRAWALAHQHHAGDAHARAVARALQIGARENAFARDARAEEAHGMGFERKPQGAVVVHHMLRERHDGERDLRFSTRFARRGVIEQTVAAAPSAGRAPPTAPGGDRDPSERKASAAARRSSVARPTPPRRHRSRTSLKILLSLPVVMPA